MVPLIQEMRKVAEVAMVVAVEAQHPVRLVRPKEAASEITVVALPTPVPPQVSLFFQLCYPTSTH